MPSSNPFRIVGDAALIDVGTKKYPRKEAVIDAADLPLVLDGRGRWYARSSNGRILYATRTVVSDGKKVAVQMHRHIFGLAAGHAVIPDHQDRDGLNNRRSNLRLTTHAGNKANAIGVSHKQFKGVFARKPRTPTEPVKYRAIIGVDGDVIRLGDYLIAEDAARAYDDAARQHFGEFALTNFPLNEVSR